MTFTKSVVIFTRSVGSVMGTIGIHEFVSLWQNSTVLGAYDPRAVRALKDERAVRALKDEVDGGIYISGSGTLVRALLADGLVDELHLLVYPIVLGSGAKLFSHDMQRTPLALASQEALENGVLHLTYTPAGS
jgi:riboflavin biosynthesis pyrimidine reductase